MGCDLFHVDQLVTGTDVTWSSGLTARHSHYHMQKYDRAVIRKTFGVTMRTFRKRLGYAQERLALEANVDRGYMSGLERGLHVPSIHTVYKFLPLLQITFVQFAEEFERELRRKHTRK